MQAAENQLVNTFLRHGKNQPDLGNEERPLTQEDVKALSPWNRVDYERSLQEQARCRNCTGVNNCKNRLKGHYEESFMSWGIFYYRVVECKHNMQRASLIEQGRIYKNSGIPDQFSNDTFSDYELTTSNMKAVEVSKYLVSKPEDLKGVLFYGGAGTGKTKLVSIIANEKIKQGKQLVFTTVPSLLAAMRNSINTGSLEQVTRRYENAEILVLDDLGSERITDWVGERLFSLIDYRKNKNLQTIVTTNRTPQGLERYLSVYDKEGQIDDLWGRRIVGRLREMCYFIKLDGPDYRKKVN